MAKLTGRNPQPYNLTVDGNKTKVTKEVLCEESRFILANVMAEARYGRQNRYDDIRRVCEGAVTIPFTEYIGFLEVAGYLFYDRTTESLAVTEAGEQIVNGGNLSELTNHAVAHFKNAQRRRGGGGSGARTLSNSPRATPQPQRPQRTSSLPPPPPPSSSVAAALANPGSPASFPNSATAAAIGAGTGMGPSYAPISSAASASTTSRTSSNVLDSRYEKLEEIGTGGIGKVFRSRQVPLNREIAVKEIRELFGFFAQEQHIEIRRRFTQVVQAAANLTHPNILPIHDVNFDREAPYVVCEFAKNGSCRRLIAEAESIPVSLSIKYLLQTLHALHAAHKQGVSHRGLKPENMLIDAYGNVKVSDFGMARIVERDQSVIRQVYVGMGSVAYMAPELFSEPAGAGVQTDIYALGIIFYELLTRKLPGRRSPMPSEIDSNIPRGIDDIFDRMTRDDCSERYDNVADILADFDRIPNLSELVGIQSQALEASNPLSEVTFKKAADDSDKEGDEDKGNGNVKGRSRANNKTPKDKGKGKDKGNGNVKGRSRANDKTPKDKGKGKDKGKAATTDRSSETATIDKNSSD